METCAPRLPSRKSALRKTGCAVAAGAHRDAPLHPVEVQRARRAPRPAARCTTAPGGGRHVDLRVDPGGGDLGGLLHLGGQRAVGDGEDVGVELGALVPGPHLGDHPGDGHRLAVGQLAAWSPRRRRAAGSCPGVTAVQNCSGVASAVPSTRPTASPSRPCSDTCCIVPHADLPSSGATPSHFHDHAVTGDYCPDLPRYEFLDHGVVGCHPVVDLRSGRTAAGACRPAASAGRSDSDRGGLAGPAVIRPAPGPASSGETVRHTSSTRSAAVSAPNRCGPPSQSRCAQAALAQQVDARPPGRPRRRPTTTTSATARQRGPPVGRAPPRGQHDRPHRRVGEGVLRRVEGQARGTTTTSVGYGGQPARASPGAPRPRPAGPRDSPPGARVPAPTSSPSQSIRSSPEDPLVGRPGQPFGVAVQLHRAVDAGDEVDPHAAAAARRRTPRPARRRPAARRPARARAAGSPRRSFAGRPGHRRRGLGRAVLAVAPGAAPAVLVTLLPTRPADHVGKPMHGGAGWVKNEGPCRATSTS